MRWSTKIQCHFFFQFEGNRVPKYIQNNYKVDKTQRSKNEQIVIKDGCDCHRLRKVTNDKLVKNDNFSSCGAMKALSASYTDLSVRRDVDDGRDTEI